MGAFRSRVVSWLPGPVVKRLRAVQAVKRDLVDESQIICHLAPQRGVLVDVGAHVGSVTSKFLDRGWSVVAYEPDPANRDQFVANIGDDPRVQLSSSAVSDKPAQDMALFTSSKSAGISTLAAFHESHEPTAVVDVVTLAEDLRNRGVDQVDFLKVDIEGFDLFALKGYDWTQPPRFVLFEFEDRKTVPLGYSLADSAAYVADRRYHLLYSVWEPIEEYGSNHRWRGLFTYPPADAAQCWGNVLCFRDRSDLERALRFHSRWWRTLACLR